MLKRILFTAASTTALVTGLAVPTAGAQQEADGLVVVQIDDTNVNVVVPINAAVAVAANVCNIAVDANVLAAVDEGGQAFEGGPCDSRNRNFAGQDLVIRNN